MTHPALADAVAALHAEGRPRVWSLVVTVFGDAAEPRGGRMPVARLRVLLDLLGVEGGALRTALSRLAADGWLTRERDGRAAIYRLSPRGLAETRPAARRVYAAPAPDPDSWTLGLGPAPAGAVPLGSDAWLAAGGPVSGQVAVTGRLLVPDAAGLARACPAPVAAALAQARAEALALAAAAPALAPDAAMAARTLLIHRWRRLVLRGQDRPAALLPPALAAPDPRRAVAAAYAALLPASERWLDGSGPGLAGLPRAGPALAARFRPDIAEG